MAAAPDMRIIARNGQTRISLPKDYKLVEATPMLDWAPEAAAGGGAARMEMELYAAINAFASRRFHQSRNSRQD